MTDLVHKYELTKRPGEALVHCWTCVGPLGGVHLHVRDCMPGDDWTRFLGGLEFHYRTPPGYLAKDPPSHEKCWLIDAPCWHDGTSLYASETLIPFWRADPDNHERMFARLAKEYPRLAPEAA